MKILTTLGILASLVLATMAINGNLHLSAGKEIFIFSLSLTMAVLLTQALKTKKS